MLLPGALPRDFYEILFEVLEYKIDVASKVLGTLLNVTGNAQNQIEEGIRITTERIQRAIGETGTPNS